MPDVLPRRPDEFKALANQVGSASRHGVHETDTWDLGPAPGHIRGLCIDDNDALMSGIQPAQLDLEVVASAGSVIPPEAIRDYAPWRDFTFAFTEAACAYPEHERELCDLWHRLCARPGAFEGAFPHGYDRSANTAKWDEFLAATAMRRAAGGVTITIASLFYQAATYGWRPPLSTSAVFPEIRPEVDPFVLRNVMAAPYKRRPVHGGLGHRGEVTLLVSAGGLAKSTYMTSASLAVAFGRDLLGHPVAHPLTVAYVNAEDRRGEVGLRFKAAVNHFKLSGPAIDRVYVIGAGDLPGLALTEIDLNTRHERVSEPGMQAIRRLVTAKGIAFMVLDPLAALVPHGGNDNGLMAAVMRGLKGIAEDCDCAIVIVAHTRKGSNVEVDGAEITSGAAALTNLSRGVKGVRRPPASVISEIGVPFGQEDNIRELMDLKANLGPLSKHEYFRLVAVPMGNGTTEYPNEDWVAVADKFTPQPGTRTLPDVALRDVAVTFALGAQGGGAPYSSAPQAKDRFYVPYVATVLQARFPTMSEPQRKLLAKEAYAYACIHGWIETRDVMIPGTRNKRPSLYVRWDDTPWRDDPAPGPYII
ncbi:MAG: AAA family ATPase [Phenylobacterium sp.]|uniref:AAA family ATPase n=1 Tax=Phenylobacterium sp. TaxID=1871053 RepID=UPI00271E4662|nr:AAA family ATPase [Phenylobacterium sp.]MDO8910696.1 AAA family ATPase [Phenylobacterium sp.]MDP3099050.1 AAA family ATPase [Phenylobacterium sp.]